MFAAEDNKSLDADNRWVLLCYGNGGQGIAFPVLLEAFDAETQWRQLRDAWYAKRGGRRLRQLLHPLGFGVKKIDRARVGTFEHPWGERAKADVQVRRSTFKGFLPNQAMVGI